MANQFIIHGLSEEGKAYRAALEAIQELHKAVAFYGEDADWWVCGHCHDKHPCATRSLADEALNNN